MTEMKTVYIIRKSSMSGDNGYLDVAYTNKYVVDQKCPREEWTTFYIEEEEAEIIDGNRCIVKNAVFQLDRTTRTEYIQNRALSKLTEEEKMLLGFECDLAQVEEYVEFDCWRCKDTGEYEVSMPPYDIDTALCTCDAGKQLAKERKLKLEDTHFTGIPPKKRGS